MPHHFPKNTVQAEVFCPKCMKLTPWRIAGGRRAYCLVCYGRPQPSKPVAKPDPAQQLEMFGKEK